MKTRFTKTPVAAALGLLFTTFSSPAAELIDSGPMEATASGAYPSRDAWRTLIGLTDNGTHATKNTISLVGDPNDPADYRLDATAGGNTQYGQYTCWSHSSPANQWLRIDLGAEYEFDSMAFFNLAVSTGSNSNRGVQQGDIYYRDMAADAGNNTNGDGGPFDPTGWTILGTAGTQTFTQTTAGDPAIEPDVISFGGVTARYVAIDVNTTWGGTAVGIAELLFFKAGAVSDPVLAIDGGSPNSDYNFGTVYEGSTAPTRSVTFVNNSVSTNETITLNSITLTDDGGGAFGTPIVTYSGTNVLSNGDTVTIEVPLGFDVPGNVTGTLEILTTSSGGIVPADFNDKTLNLTSTVIASGERMNPNPFLETGLANWDLPGGSPPVAVSPGLAGGSHGMARVPGVGDPSNLTASASFMQSNQLTNGAPNWQLSAFLSPINADDFASYADPDGSLSVTGADGEYADRTFQLLVRATDTGRPFPAFDDPQVANTMINLAYMPDGVPSNPDPDFYVFNGTTGEWEATGIGAIAGSTDNDTDGDPLNGTGDGLLDPSIDPLDVVNAYRIIVTGTGFGAPGASYDITVTKVSGTDTFVSGTATDLSAFHGTSGETGTPAGYAFITSDISESANVGSEPGFTTPFWVDDVSFFNVAGPDPSPALLSAPETILVTSPDTTGGTSFTIRNDGTFTALEDVTISIAGTTGFTVTAPTGSFDLAPGAIQKIDVEWDSAASGATPVYETATLTFSSSNFPDVEIALEAGVLVDRTMVLDNGDFETPGADNVTDTDTFASWVEDITADAITDVTGLIAPSATAAALAPAATAKCTLSQAVTSAPLINFTLDFDFAVAGVARDLYLLLQSANSLSRANIGYVPGKFIAYDQTTSSFKDVLVIDLTPGTPYKLKTTGTGWGTANPTLGLEVFDAAGTSLGSSAPFAYYQYFPPVAGLARLDFTTTFGGSGGVTVDEISLDGQVLDTTPPASNLLLANPVFVPGAPNTVTADISGGMVDIYRSSTGETGSWGSPVATDLAPGTGVEIDPDASLAPTALYIAVAAGGSAP